MCAKEEWSNFTMPFDYWTNLFGNQNGCLGQLLTGPIWIIFDQPFEIQIEKCF
jgi:hypothetical protein